MDADNTLPPDEYRCYDYDCSQCNECLRYLDRKSGTKSLPSLFPHDIPIDSPCPLRIPPKEKSYNAG